MLVDPVMAELSTRFDPYSLPTGLSPQFVLGVIAGWREQAWRNAELLIAAPDPSARAQVAAVLTRFVTPSGVEPSGTSGAGRGNRPHAGKTRFGPDPAG
jgi:hypothetical protein